MIFHLLYMPATFGQRQPQKGGAMGHTKHRIVGWILEPSAQNQCACGAPATVHVALYGDLCQVIEQCRSCTSETATDEIAEVLAAALTSPSPQEA
jgi:hypothetical protein